MIIKSYELKKLDLNKNKYILFYGANEGAKTEEINRLKLLNKDKTFINYEEKQILENSENIYNNIFSKSLFENKKIIAINRTTDKLLKIIEDVLEKNFVDIYLIFISDNLEKKSKLRSLFEKRKILISQAHVNLIVNKCNGDRGILKNELSKIELFSKNKTKISSENLLKLVNLVENHSISELIDNCLAKNQKKTINILNDNNFSSEDCIIITRTFINKSKRIMKLSEDYQSNGNLDTTIANAKPPIFWKNKEIVKQQINKWSPNQISELIYSLNEIELQINKNYTNPVNIVSDFILNQASTSL